MGAGSGGGSINIFNNNFNQIDKIDASGGLGGTAYLTAGNGGEGSISINKIK